MISKQIIITYELLKREIFFLEELSSLFRSKGYKVYILHQQLAFRMVQIFKPSLIIFKSADKGRIPWYKKAIKYGHKIICIDSEGLLIDPWEYVNIRVNVANLKLMFAYFTCGDYQKKIITETYPEFSNKIFSVGTPSLKLIRNLNSNLSTQKEKYDVGILTGFGGIDSNSNSTYLNLIKSMTNKGVFEQFKKNYKEYINIIKRASDTFQNLVSLIEKEYPNYKINIRVHNSENPSNWENFCKRNKNIIISKESNIVEFLQNCKHVISWKSTVAIEALALNKTIISFTPTNIDPKNLVYPNKEPENTTKNFKGIKELLYFLNHDKIDLSKNEKIIANRSAELISKGFNDKEWSPSLEIFNIVNQNKSIKFKIGISESNYLHDIYVALNMLLRHFIFIILNFNNYYPYGKLKIGNRKQFAKIYNKFPNRKRKMFYYFAALFSRIIILNPNKD